MARKKQEIALQLEIETQEEWEECLTKEGLTVIDVYQEWAGPCKAMLANFRRMRNELSDDALHFAVAKADTIDSLERYRGKCQPCFLFYGGGVLVNVIRGANAPVLSKTVIDELKKEHMVMKGETERKEINDPQFGHVDEKSSLDESENEKSDEIEMIPKEVTVALIKPDIVKEGKAEEVLAKMRESGIEVLKHEERQLTEEEARDFYSHLNDEPFFDELVQFMCSGPSHVLLLSKPDTGRGIIKEWRELIGPTSVEEAKEKAPDSLRAQYGTKEMFNALHGSDSHDASIRELAFFFPEYQVPTVAKPGSKGVSSRVGVQRTLALIRPEAIADKKEDIIKRIEEAGFEIALQKEIQLTREQAEGFYVEHKEQPYFEELMEKMTSGPVLALGLARNDAISEWRKLLGPTKVSEAKEQAPESLRAQFSVDGTEVNMLHGSDSPTKAEQELNFFFPVQQTVAVVKPDAYDNKDAILDKIKEAGFHVAARKETTLTRDIAQMLYKQNSSQDYYNDLIDHMTSGPTLFMVLTKEDAVENWRGIIGPTDPAQAKEEAPHSLRAQFGSDTKANAVHGPSTEEDAKAVIDEIFGDLKTNTDGSVDPGQSVLKEGVEVVHGETAATKSSTSAGEVAADETGPTSESAAPDTTQKEEGTEAAPPSEPAAAETATEPAAEAAAEPATEAAAEPTAELATEPAAEEAPQEKNEPAAEAAVDAPAAEAAPDHQAPAEQHGGDETTAPEETGEAGAAATSAEPAAELAAEESSPAPGEPAESEQITQEKGADPAAESAEGTASPPAAEDQRTNSAEGAAP